jgi:hypothetical protein
VTRALHLALALSLLAAVVLHSQQSAEDATARAVKYLAREVPRWQTDEGCYSCHNNGDAARALMAASATDPAAIGVALADTFKWLADPPAWNRAVVNRGVDNKILARIQFAAALTDAVARGDAPAAALAAAADMVAADQEADGFWRVDTGDNVGSPVTYGAALATGNGAQGPRRVRARRGGAGDRAGAWLADSRAAAGRPGCRGRLAWLAASVDRRRKSRRAPPRRRQTVRRAKRARWLGPVSDGRRRAIRHRAGDSGVTDSRLRPGTRSRDRVRPRLAALHAVRRRLMAGDDAAGGTSQLCAIDIDDRMVSLGAQ